MSLTSIIIIIIVVYMQAEQQSDGQSYPKISSKLPTLNAESELMVSESDAVPA